MSFSSSNSFDTSGAPITFTVDNHGRYIVSKGNPFLVPRSENESLFSPEECNESSPKGFNVCEYSVFLDNVDRQIRAFFLQGETSGATLDVTPEATSGATPETTLDATSGTTPEVTPETTSGTTPEVTLDATSGTTPETTPVETSGATPETTPVETSGATPETTPVETPEATSDNP
jgi:hypothetical protein